MDVSHLLFNSTEGFNSKRTVDSTSELLFLHFSFSTFTPNRTFTTLKSNLEFYWVDLSFQHEIIMDNVDVSFNDLRLFYLKECLFLSLFVCVV